MPITFRCPNPACGHTTVLSESAVGTSFRCPGCSKTVSVRTTVDGQKPAPRTVDRPSSETGATRIGRFVVRERLGAGAFGTVYRAHDPQLDREVALKVPNPGSLDSPKRVERFLREAKAAANLRHPHIVPVFDAGKDGDQYYIASAFIRGKPMSDLVEDGALAFERAAQLVRQLAEALAYAHSEGIVHRDVKPANVMVDDHDRVHLMDFGLASRRDEESRLTNDGAVMGTPAYMAPEQAAGQQGEAQPSADQYACGVVLYELLTGKVPFEGQLAVVIHNVIHTQPEPPSRERTNLPRDLETICLKALSKRPEDRYQGCLELANDLGRWLEGEPIAARRLPPWEQMTRWVRRNKVVAGLIAAVSTSLITGIAVSVALAAHARGEANRADQQASAAHEARDLAEVIARNEAEARTQAVQAQQTTEVERKRAEQAGRDLRNTLHCANMQLLQSAWEQGHLDRVARLLQSSLPQPGAEDDRGLEWGYWQNTIRRRSVLGKYRDTWAICIAFGPGLDTLVSGHNTGTIRIWNLRQTPEGRTRGEFRPIKAHSGNVSGVAYASSGKWIASAGEDGVLKLWSPETLAEQRSLAGTGRPWKSLAASADDRWLAAGDDQGAVRVWKTEPWMEWCTFPAPPVQRPVHGLDFAPASDRLYVAGSGTKLECWDLATRKAGTPLTSPGLKSLVAVAVSPDQSSVAGATAEGQIVTWSASTGQVTGRRDDAHDGMVLGVGWVQNGTGIASCGYDQKVRIWNPARSSKVTLRGHGAFIRGLAVHRTGTLFASASFDGLVLVWNPDERQESIAISALRSMYTTAAYAGGGKLLAAGRADGQLDVLSGSGKLIGSVTLSGRVSAMASVPGTNCVVASVGPDNHINVVDTELMSIVRKWPAPGIVKNLAVSPDGKRVAAACWDKSCRVWTIATGEQVLSLDHRSEVWAVAYSPDGATLATACSLAAGNTSQDRVAIYDANSGVERYKLDGIQNRTLALAFTPDGLHLLVAGGWILTPSQTPVLSIASKQVTGSLVGHNEFVTAVTVNTNGKRAVTVSQDRTIRVWDLRSRVEVLAVPSEHPLIGLTVAADDSGMTAVDATGRLLLMPTTYK